jgi:methionyl-tRNA formyltransferase
MRRWSAAGSTPRRPRRPPAAEPARAIFFGSGAFAVPVLVSLATAPDVVLIAVVTAPPRPVGRSGSLGRTPVGERAAALGIPVLAPERLRDPAVVAGIAALRPEIGVLADYGKLLPEAILGIPPHGILNLHPSLLPRHRGATPIPAAIFEGDAETGVSLFRMDAGMDTGPIVATEPVALAGDEDTPGLEGRLASVAAALLGRSLGPWLRGDLPAIEQSRERVSITRPFRREDGRLDPALPAAILERQVRACRPWPGTFIETPAGRVAVLRAEVARARAGDVPGGLERDGDAGLALATAAGRLRLLEVQPAGGRRMDSAALVRGRPGLVGARVG